MYRLKSEDDERGYLSRIISAAFLIWIVVYFFPGTIPFEVWSFWTSKNADNWQWFNIGAPLFIWGLVLQLVLCIWSFRDDDFSDDAHEKMIKWGILGTIAGIVEEIGFRWLLFLGGIISAKITNYFFFGFLGFGTVEWFQTTIAGPIANFFTLGYLSEYLTKPEMWAVGAGILSANALFRDGHKYQGIIGILNSWFGGMFLFWVMFNHGLPTCILIHIFYNLTVNLVAYIARLVHRVVY